MGIVSSLAKGLGGSSGRKVGKLGSKAASVNKRIDRIASKVGQRRAYKADTKMAEREALRNGHEKGRAGHMYKTNYTGISERKHGYGDTGGPYPYDPDPSPYNERHSYKDGGKSQTPRMEKLKQGAEKKFRQDTVKRIREGKININYDKKFYGHSKASSKPDSFYSNVGNVTGTGNARKTPL